MLESRTRREIGCKRVPCASQRHVHSGNSIGDRACGGCAALADRAAAPPNFDLVCLQHLLIPSSLDQQPNHARLSQLGTYFSSPDQPYNHARLSHLEVVILTQSPPFTENALNHTLPPPCLNERFSANITLRTLIPLKLPASKAPNRPVPSSKPCA